MIVRTKLPPYQRRKSGLTKTSKYLKMISQTLLNDLPNGTELLESQVAGHAFQIGTDEIGSITLCYFLLFPFISSSSKNLINCLRFEKHFRYAERSTRQISVEGSR